MDNNSPNLKIAGDEPQRGCQLADFVQARLHAAAQAYWTAIFPSIAVPWNDAFSKTLGVLCELLAERDDLVDAISRTSIGETGMSQGQRGEPCKHPLSSRLNQIEVQIHGQMKAFGMTPAGLKRLGSNSRGKGSRLDRLTDLIS